GQRAGCASWCSPAPHCRGEWAVLRVLRNAADGPSADPWISRISPVARCAQRTTYLGDGGPGSHNHLGADNPPSPPSGRSHTRPHTDWRTIVTPLLGPQRALVLLGSWFPALHQGAEAAQQPLAHTERGGSHMLRRFTVSLGLTAVLAAAC